MDRKIIFGIVVMISTIILLYTKMITIELLIDNLIIIGAFLTVAFISLITLDEEKEERREEKKRKKEKKEGNKEE